jgi:2-polyprenyl-3-methyl-5-hydroxy-6-metoxy-1,4-benzoquinol methylase
LEELKKAKKNGYRSVFKINLNNDPLILNLGTKKYDVIICADILEHLIYPEKILFTFKKYLKKNGRIIISLPNIGFILNRIHLLQGKWEYQEFGCRDKTHLRFYTINSGIEMVKSANLQIQDVKPYNQFGMLRKIKPLDVLFPALFSFQFIIVAKNT